MTNTNKMTNRKAINYVLDNYKDSLPADVVEKFNAMLVALDKKSTADRKPTAKQVENDNLRAEIVAFINENAEGDGFTVSDLLKVCPACAAIEGLTNQRVSALLRQAKLAKEVSKHSVKRHTYFVPYDEKYDEEGEEA